MPSDATQVADMIVTGTTHLVNLLPKVKVHVENNAEVLGGFGWFSVHTHEVYWELLQILFTLSFVTNQEELSLAWVEFQFV